MDAAAHDDLFAKHRGVAPEGHAGGGQEGRRGGGGIAGFTTSCEQDGFLRCTSSLSRVCSRHRRCGSHQQIHSLALDQRQAAADSNLRTASCFAWGRSKLAHTNHRQLQRYSQNPGNKYFCSWARPESKTNHYFCFFFWKDGLLHSAFMPHCNQLPVSRFAAPSRSLNSRRSCARTPPEHRWLFRNETLGGTCMQLTAARTDGSAAAIHVRRRQQSWLRGRSRSGR